eukprot:13372692-Ditylum_brightwellii.AAC.1
MHCSCQRYSPPGMQETYDWYGTYQECKNTPPGDFIEHSEADEYVVMYVSGGLLGYIPLPGSVASKTEDM